MKKFALYLLEIFIILILYGIVTGGLYYFTKTHITSSDEWLMIYIAIIVLPSYLLSVVFDKWFKNKFIENEIQSRNLDKF